MANAASIEPQPVNVLSKAESIHIWSVPQHTYQVTTSDLHSHSCQLGVAPPLRQQFHTHTSLPPARWRPGSCADDERNRTARLCKRRGKQVADLPYDGGRPAKGAWYR